MWGSLQSKTSGVSRSGCVCVCICVCGPEQTKKQPLSPTPSTVKPASHSWLSGLVRSPSGMLSDPRAWWPWILWEGMVIYGVSLHCARVKPEGRPERKFSHGSQGVKIPLAPPTHTH